MSPFDPGSTQWSGREPDQVHGAAQGGARVWGDEAENRVRGGALSRTGEKCEPVVCNLRGGEPFLVRKKLLRAMGV